MDLVTSGQSVFFVSRTLHFVLFFSSRVFALGHLTWAYWACLANSLDLACLKLHTFLLILGSTHVNLQLKPKKTETKHNKRNVDIKH